MYPIFECLDGWVRMVILSPRQWESLWDWMGKPDAFGDKEFWSQVGNRIMNADVLNPAYEEFFAGYRQDPKTLLQRTFEETDALLAACRQGPPMAKVTGIGLDPVGDPSVTGFVVLPTA